jgi:hypothetical protein
VLDLHGGAWNGKDRKAEEPMDRALAASGVLVVAIDLTLAPEAPYPGLRAGRQLRRALAESESGVVERRSVEDRHLRELERRTRRRTARHAPRDPRYNAIPLPEAPASMPRWPTSRRVADQQHVRALQNAVDKKREPMIANNKTFFNPWDTIHESNPQEILERHERRDAGAAADHAGRARRQRAARGAGEVRRRLQRRRREMRLPRLRGQRARMGRQGRSADRAALARW